MTEQVPPAPDPEAQKATFKTWFNEVLDERQAAREQAERDAEEAKRTTAKPTILQSLFGG
jgi:hypothetical protein